MILGSENYSGDFFFFLLKGVNVEIPSLRIPHTRYVEFLKCHEHDYPGLRFGQAFHTYMKFERVVNDKGFFDKLYIANDVEARDMILSLLDYRQ